MSFQNNLQPTDNGGWTARTTVYVGGTAKIRQKTFSLGNSKDNRASAQKWLSAQERLRAGLSLLSPATPASLGELAEMYLGVVERDVKDITYDGYQRSLSCLLSIFDHSHHPFLTQAEIDWYIEQRKDAGAGRSIIAELNCLRRALARFHIDPQWNIPRWLQRIPKQERYVPTVDDYHRLLVECPPETIKAVRMALLGGLRDQEVFRVLWQAYSHRSALMTIDATIRKTNSTNVIPIVKSLSDSLTPPKDSGEMVERSQSAVKNDLRTASKRAGIHTWHGLQPARRLFVTLAEDEFDHDTISLITGHRRMSMASRYSSGYGHIPLKRKVIEYVERRLA